MIIAVIKFELILEENGVKIGILEAEDNEDITFESIKLASEGWGQMTSRPVAVMEKGQRVSNLFLKFKKNI